MSSNTNPAIPAAHCEKCVANPSTRLADESNTASKTLLQKCAIKEAKKAEEVKKAMAALSICIDTTNNAGSLICQGCGCDHKRQAIRPDLQCKPYEALRGVIRG